jgi:hypothetical protein
MHKIVMIRCRPIPIYNADQESYLLLLSVLYFDTTYSSAHACAEIRYKNVKLSTRTGVYNIQKES